MSRRGGGTVPLVPYLPITVCLVLLASCATTEDGIAARRSRAVQTLNGEKVWKSPATQVEPQVMPAPRIEREIGAADGPESVAAPVASGTTTTGTADASSLLEADEGTEATALVKDTNARAPEGDERSWLDVPDEELERELLLRKLHQWENQAGGYSRASNLAPDNEEQQLAREIVTLSFISDGPLDEAGLARAATTLGATGDREDLLRAALALQQLGRTSESEELLRLLTNEQPDQDAETTAAPAPIATERAETDETLATVTTATTVESAGTVDTAGTVDLAGAVEATETTETAATVVVPAESTPSGASAFKLVSVTFASRIDGPGDFVAMPAEAIERGKDVLVYGEFAGFRTIEYRAEAGDQPTHSRAFSASLRLQDAESNILEELKFLPPSRGKQFVDDPGEAVNFWARYQIPEELGAGRYEIVITAEDHFGGQSAQAELAFALK